MSARALVLGASGMLGSTLLREFRRVGIETLATVRQPQLSDESSDLRLFDVQRDPMHVALGGLDSGDYVINCVGVIKHLMRDDVAADRLRAVHVNSMFPYNLAAAAEERGIHVIQIATDCVYSGSVGQYSESAEHDATDVYGQSKSLGEVPGRNVLNLRCSIIGPELGSKTSLLEWVIGHSHGARVSGYTDHRWNGVTTSAFAHVAAGIVQSGDRLAGTHHLVPADAVTKAELVRLIASSWGRDDLIVDDVTTARPIDRTLSTNDPSLSRRLWLQGGYPAPPSIAEMIAAQASARA